MFVASLPLLSAIAAIFFVLAVGTLVRVVAIRGVPSEKSQASLNSLKSWWVLAFVLAISLLSGRLGCALLLATAGTLSLVEHLRLVGWEKVGFHTSLVVFTILPLYYLVAWLGYAEELRSCSPIAFVLIIGALRAWLGLTADFMRTTAATIWGLMLFVLCLSHAFFLLELPISATPWVGGMGWFLYLVLLTETNDIAQALIGRRFGKTKISPRISPNKSVEGLCGGIVATTTLAVVISPWLTTLAHQQTQFYGILSALISGLVISVFGFLGDINKSGIKRDVGVKDSGTLLPGQGGMMDRIDSLTFSAPAFYYLILAIANTT
jgi:phosphatidate cytidylyltransferase